MNYTYYNNLKSIDITGLSSEIGHLLPYASAEQAISIAFCALTIKKEESHKCDSFSEFKKNYHLSKEVLESLDDKTSSHWKGILEIQNRFSIKELEAFILFYNYSSISSDTPTPIPLIDLACGLLNIRDGENVLDLCMGTGNFFVESFKNYSKCSYTGVELNYSSKNIATLRTSLLGNNYNLILGDALETTNSKKYDKLFTNYPFMPNSNYMDNYKDNICKRFGMKENFLQRASANWLFNAMLVSLMKDNGKAVAIMPNGAAWNTNDLGVRQYFIENGYIETVISLPGGLFSGTQIPVTMIVFSHNNKSIKMIDARECCEKNRRTTVMTSENISNILSLIKNGGEVVINKNINDFSESNYFLNAERYLKAPTITNGVRFETIIHSITRGAQVKASEIDKISSKSPTKYQYLMLANINDGIVNIKADGQYLKDIPNNLEKYCIPNKAIVLSKIGSPDFKSAVVNIAEDQKVLANGNMFVITIDETKANPYFIQAFFESDSGVAQFQNIYSGISLKTITIEQIEKMIVPLPSMNYQDSVATKYLAAMDEYIILKSKIERVIDRLKHIQEG